MSQVTSGSLPLRSASYWEEIGQLAATPVQAHRKTFCQIPLHTASSVLIPDSLK